MRKYLEYLCCPKCKADLIINEGSLICIKCSEKYEVVNGIPILVDLKNLPHHLNNQIKYFENDFDTSNDFTLEEWQKKYIERFVNNFYQIKDQLVIDCGTGSGYMAIELAKRGANLIACDLTLSSLLRLKNIVDSLRMSDNFVIVCCSADSLPIKHSIADYFISNAVLEHLPDEEATISELNRVCKTTAGLMITVPFRFKYVNPLQIPVNYFHDRRIGHLRRYDEQKLLTKFKNWNKLKTYYTGHFMKVLKVLINLIVKLFDEEKIEQNDAKKDFKPWGANNISVMFNRNNR